MSRRTAETEISYHITSGGSVAVWERRFRELKIPTFTTPACGFNTNQRQKELSGHWKSERCCHTLFKKDSSLALIGRERFLCSECSSIIKEVYSTKKKKKSNSHHKTHVHQRSSISYWFLPALIMQKPQIVGVAEQRDSMARYDVKSLAILLFRHLTWYKKKKSALMDKASQGEKSFYGLQQSKPVFIC